MIQSGKSYSVSFPQGDRQLVMCLYGDANQHFEACFSATVSYIRRAGEIIDIEPIGFGEITTNTIESLNGALLKWLREFGLENFADDRVITKLRELFAKAGYR